MTVQQLTVQDLTVQEVTVQDLTVQEVTCSHAVVRFTPLRGAAPQGVPIGGFQVQKWTSYTRLLHSGPL